MALRWFRQNKRFTRWVYLAVTIFTMLTFSVVASVESFFSCSGNGSHDPVIGKFETNGTVHEITGTEFTAMSQNMARFGMTSSDDRKGDSVWHFLMLDQLARDAGIVVSDAMVRDFLRASFGIETKEHYTAFLNHYSLQSGPAHELFASLIRVNIYTTLNRDNDKPSSDEIFNRFKQDNEMISLRYVAFDDDAFAAQLDPAKTSEDDLKKFYSDELASTVKTNEYSTPEKFVLDAAIIDPETATIESLVAVLPADEQSVSDEDAQTFYDDNRELWRKPKAASAPASAPENASAPATPANDEDEDADSNFKPLSEVRDDVKKRVLAGRVVSAAAQFYREERDKQKKAAADLAASQPASAPATAPAPPADVLPAMIEKFHLTLVEFKDPVAKDALKDLPTIGSDTQLAQYVAFLSAGDVSPREPDEDLKIAYVLRMKERIAPVALPFDEVKDRLRATWKKETAKKKSQEAADRFRAALKDKAKEKVKDDVAKIEDAARAAGTKQADDSKVTDEAERQKIIDAAVKSKQPEIDALIGGHEGEVFDATLAELSLTATTLPEFRKSYHRTMFWNDDAPSAARFLQGQELVFNVAKGGVYGPLRDDQTHAVYVCQVVDRREPKFEEMRLGDKARAEAMVNQARMMAMRTGNAPNALSMERLATELRLQRKSDSDAKDTESP